MFIEFLEKTKGCSYFEFGAGGSTYQANLRENINSITSVESDFSWIEKIQKNVSQCSGNSEKKIKFIFVDLNSAPNSFGYPGEKFDSSELKKYSDAVLQEKDNSIDIVFIDGRFRVACALKSFSKLKDDGIILFDDFLNRRQYHVVLDYFYILDKTRDERMVALKKKSSSHPPPNDLIFKYETIAD